MAKRKNKKDGRSNPKLKYCPPEEQRYIIRMCLEEGLFKVGQCEGSIPDTKVLEKYLRKHGYDEGTFVLLSTRPRPKHVATYRFIRVNKLGQKKRKLIQDK
ncbi:MAG: hypothetical protein KAS32_18255 [Candidatus Peribacteraceae bacterium]|nr:hypothetical protein [Candidatus Peribacteraceae bacterium]